MSAKVTATPAGMKWCGEHKQWEHINLDGGLHLAVGETAPEYKAHIAALVELLPGNGERGVRHVGQSRSIVTDGLITEFYCPFHWSQRSDEQDGLDWMARAEHDPLSDEEKKTFGIEEAS